MSLRIWPGSKWMMVFYDSREQASESSQNYFLWGNIRVPWSGVSSTEKKEASELVCSSSDYMDLN
jgi:hypothetical protein